MYDWREEEAYRHNLEDYHFVEHDPVESNQQVCKFTTKIQNQIHSCTQTIVILTPPGKAKNVNLNISDDNRIPSHETTGKITTMQAKHFPWLSDPTT